MWRFGNSLWWSSVGWTVLRFWIAAFFAFKAAKLAMWLGLPPMRVSGYAIDVSRMAVAAATFVALERVLAYAWKNDAPGKAQP